MNDRELLLAIQAILSDGEWSPDTPQAIAELMEANGYPITDAENVPEHPLRSAVIEAIAEVQDGYRDESLDIADALLAKFDVSAKSEVTK